MEGLFKDLVSNMSGNAAIQSLVVMLVGLVAKHGAQWLQTNKPPDERGKLLIHIAVTLLSLVMGFMQQWSSGALNAFDPKPWTDFVTVLMASWGMITATEKGSEKAVKFIASLKGE